MRNTEEKVLKEIGRSLKDGTISEDMARHWLASYINFQISTIVADRLDFIFRRTFK